MKNNNLIKYLVIFCIVSILSIYSSTFILSINYKTIWIKQIIWYLISFLLLFLIYKKKKGFFYKYGTILYIIGNILLILVLFIGTNTNGSNAWINIFGLSFQPSEFIKIPLVIVLANILSNEDEKDRSLKHETMVIIKSSLITLIPFILTFLEPDTGNAIIYIIILITMLFIYKIRYRWFIISFLLLSLFLGIFLYLYFIKQDLFINIFGTNFFYRMDRLLQWKNNEGMQLNNALTSSGSASLVGYGIGKTPIYFPEAQTDFIISIIFSNFGYILSTIFLIITFFFDVLLIKICFRRKRRNRYLISGIISSIIFSQIQNIGMNLGLLPITGITLPFISYGGSSLITYMVMIGLILNINKKTSH